MIQVENLYYRYESGVEALKGVSLKISNGELVAIIGSNGAGKTTLVKHFNGLLKPTRGKVIVNGIDTREATVAELSRMVGFVFQNPDHQFFAETVEEEISFALKNFNFPQDEIEKRVDEMLKFFMLDHLRGRSPFTLSGGEKKRLALASILVFDPKILVFDEPTTGQDFYHKTRFISLIHELSKRGKTIIIVTHDVEFVAENIPRTIAMANGRIVADGPTRKILTNPHVTQEASLIMPQMSMLVRLLRRTGIPQDIISIDEAYREISKILGE